MHKLRYNVQKHFNQNRFALKWMDFAYDSCYAYNDGRDSRNSFYANLSVCEIHMNIIGWWEEVWIKFLTLPKISSGNTVGKWSAGRFFGKEEHTIHIHICVCVSMFIWFLDYSNEWLAPKPISNAKGAKAKYLMLGNCQNPFDSHSIVFKTLHVIMQTAWVIITLQWSSAGKWVFLTHNIIHAGQRI